MLSKGFNCVKKYISIFAKKIKDRLLILIIKIICQIEMQCHGGLLIDLIFIFGNKITIIVYIRNVGITYNVSTNQQKEFINNNIRKNNCNDIHPFKYALVSPKCRQS